MGGVETKLVPGNCMVTDLNINVKRLTQGGKYDFPRITKIWNKYSKGRDILYINQYSH